MWLRCTNYWYQHSAFQAENENDILPYWLANASALLCMLQRNLRSKGFIMAPSRSSSDNHLSEKANEVSSNPFSVFTFQLALYRSLLSVRLDLRFSLSLAVTGLHWSWSALGQSDVTNRACLAELREQLAESRRPNSLLSWFCEVNLWNQLRGLGSEKSSFSWFTPRTVIVCIEFILENHRETFFVSLRETLP